MATKVTSTKVNLQIDIPIRLKPYPASPQDIKDLDLHIEELTELKLIRKSHSPWSFPAFMVRNHSEQKRGKARMVIDYVKLNQCIVKDAYRIPNKDELFRRLRNSKYYSKLDCKSGFFQVKMEEDSIPYTAFSSPKGSFEWMVMPMGLPNAPSIFQFKMDNILGKHSEYCVVYIDDILIFSNNQDEHLIHLKKIAEELRDNGTIVSKKKQNSAKLRLNS